MDPCIYLRIDEPMSNNSAINSETHRPWKVKTRLGKTGIQLPSQKTRKQKVHRSIHDQATDIIQSKDTVPSFEARKADPAWIGSANYSGQNHSKESW